MGNETFYIQLIEGTYRITTYLVLNPTTDKIVGIDSIVVSADHHTIHYDDSLDVTQVVLGSILGPSYVNEREFREARKLAEKAHERVTAIIKAQGNG